MGKRTRKMVVDGIGWLFPLPFPELAAIDVELKGSLGRETRRTGIRDRVEINPKVMLGKPVIRGTRITVEAILEKLAADISIDEILDDYPRSTRLASSFFSEVRLGRDSFAGTTPARPRGRAGADFSFGNGCDTRCRRTFFEVTK